MIWLLDVNALVALGFRPHQFHRRVSDWIGAQESPAFATCSTTELGFVRVLSQAPSYGLNVVQSRALLLTLKNSGTFSFTFIADDHDITHLPTWVKFPRQTTDGHLLELARANQAVLATLDERIPGAHLID